MYKGGGVLLISWFDGSKSAFVEIQKRPVLKETVLPQFAFIFCVSDIKALLSV